MKFSHQPEDGGFQHLWQSSSQLLMSDFLTSYPLDVMTWLSLITWLEYRPKKDMGECHQSWANKFGFPYRNSRFPVCWNHREKHVSVGRSSSVEASGCATAISRLAMWHHIHEDSGYFPMWLIGTPPKFNSSPLTSYHSQRESVVFQTSFFRGVCC